MAWGGAIHGGTTQHRGTAGHTTRGCRRSSPPAPERPAGLARARSADEARPRPDEARPRPGGGWVRPVSGRSGRADAAAADVRSRDYDVARGRVFRYVHAGPADARGRDHGIA